MFLTSNTLLAQNQPLTVEGEYIIKFKEASRSANGAQQKSSLAAFQKGQNLIVSMKGIQIKRQFSKLGMMHLNSVSPAKLSLLQSHPDVEFIEPNYVLSLDPTLKDPNSQERIDALANQNSQSAGGLTAQAVDTYSQSYAQVQVTESWAIEKPAASGSITVAIIDTGLDMQHAVFTNSNALWRNLAEVNGITGVDDDGNGYIDDFNGWNFVNNSGQIVDDSDHGTHVAGIVLGAGQDIFQVPVRPSKIKIMPLKFLDGSGSGSTSNAINAIYYAVNNGAKVINNSWGGPTYSKSLQDAYKFAYDRNVVLVTAAGNSNVNLDTDPMYPAALDTPSNITVAASTSSDRRASFSNYSSTLAHIFAPGTSIISTIPGSQCSNPNNLFMNCLASLSGTSMAAPFVAGLAALALREASNLSAYQIRTLILNSFDTSTHLDNLVLTSGRSNALKVIQMAQAQTGLAPFQPTYVPIYKSDASSRAPASEAEGGGGAGGCGLVKGLTTTGSGGGSSLLEIISILSLIFIPLLYAAKERIMAKNIVRPYVRQFERYNLVKNLEIKIGEQTLSSTSESLSLGGLSFKYEGAQFEKGQKIKVKISDTNEEIDAEVVWLTEKNSFGVKFLSVTESLKNQVNQWTAGLTPA